jgi:chromosome segregation ATPase
MAMESSFDAAEPSREAARDLRVDGAHGVRRAAAGDNRAQPAIVAAASARTQHAELADADGDATLLAPWLEASGDDVPLAPSPQMLASHAAELADRLQRRLADVDRREARLNSQEAEFDSRIRNARLWIDQREAELAELEQRLAAAESGLNQRQETAAAQLEHADELSQRLKEVAEKQHNVAALEIELELARTEQQTKLDTLDFEAAACRTRQQELDQARQRCEQRQRELDAREANIYAEQERAAFERVAIDARNEELAARDQRLVAKETGLADFERRLAEQAGEIEFQRAELLQQRSAVDEQAASLAADARRLEYRQREIAAALERFERLGVVEQTMDDLQQQADAFAMRSAYLDKAEAMLAQRQAQLDECHRDLETDRREFQQESTRQRQKMARENEEQQASLQQAHREAQRREAELDQRQRALEGVADQLRGAQREALETRLAVEETWLQLQGVLAPAALDRSVGQVRARLAEQFQVESAAIARQRQELEVVRRELVEQLQALDDERSQVQLWSAAREKDIESRAARLVAREAELDAQEQQFDAQQRQWVDERSAYQHEIQQLLAHLRSAPATAA